MTLPARRSGLGVDGTRPRDTVGGDVLPRVEIEVRETTLFSATGGVSIKELGVGSWRVYPRGEQRALREKGRLLGGRFDEAVRDAERIAKENGFFFVRPSQLWLPS